MSGSPRRRLAALLLALVPGWGHIYWGRELLGLGLFTAAAIALFAWFNGFFIYRGDGRLGIVWGAGTLLGLILAFGWADIIRRTRSERVAREARERSQSLERGTAAYLRGELAAAEEEFRRCVRTAPQDADALFRLGIVAARSGESRQARRWFQRAMRYDLEDKWRWEIEKELSRLRGTPRPPQSRSVAENTTAEEEAEPASA